jgi:hypothetical protein
MTKKYDLLEFPLLKIASIYKISNGSSKLDIYHSIINNGQTVIFSTNPNDSKITAILISKENVLEHKDQPLSLLLENYEAVQHAFDDFRTRQLMETETRIVA